MNKSPIEWTHWTSNPIYALNRETGRRGWFCEKVSPGCAHCYSSTQNEQQLRGGTGYEFLPANREHHEFVLNENELREWAKPRYAGQRCFAFDMTDLFGEWVSDAWLDIIFRSMAAAPNLQFQILTKRPERMRAYITRRTHENASAAAAWSAVEGQDYRPGWPLPNVWLGVTVENQRWADERIPILLDTPAVVRFLSCEPMLGPIDLAGIEGHPLGCEGLFGCEPKISWVICGGESGSRHRPFDPEWARDLYLQCEDIAAFFMKQMGGARPGTNLEDLPEDLQVRQFPL